MTASVIARSNPVSDRSQRRGATDTIRVCQLLHTLRVGGAEVLAARLARQLRSRCQFHFVCLDDLGTLGEELRADGFPVTVLDRRPGLDWNCAWRLAQLLRHERIDIVHAHQYTPFFYGIAARMLYRRPPVLFTEHGRHFPDFPRRKRILANRLFLERRDRVVGVGEAVRQALIANEGFSKARVGVIYNGIDTDRFTNDSRQRDLVRQEIGAGSNEFVILMVARLDYLKDHATAIRTIQGVARELPGVRLILAGDGPERDKVRLLVEQSQLTTQVRLLGQRNDINRLLSAADLFLLTSISEGIPLTVIEAMSARVPVVATRVGGMSEVVEDGVTGCLAPSGDDASLAANILRLALDPERRRQMGDEGRARAVSLFSETEMHARYLSSYEEMSPPA